MCNLQFSTGIDKKKGPHDEAGDGEDGNDSIFKSCSVEHRRQPVSDEDTDSKFEKLADILIISDGIYSK